MEGKNKGNLMSWRDWYGVVTALPLAAGPADAGLWRVPLIGGRGAVSGSRFLPWGDGWKDEVRKF
jgi:hypothetical protein